MVPKPQPQAVSADPPSVKAQMPPNGPLPPTLQVFSDDPGEDASRGALAADPPLVPDEAFLTSLAKESESLEKATPQEILRWAVDRYAPKFTMATAFGPEGMTIIHMLSEIAPETPIFNLDTGYQFAETLALRERVKERYGIEVEFKLPETTVEEYEKQHGGPLYKTDPNRCCFDRKIRVLHKAARGWHAWASAIRRDQSPDRARAPIVGWDRKFQLVKISPLANWTKKDVWSLISKESIPYNELHDKGFPSVGCEPCTRVVQIGEDERAGRWSGFQKTECGLHTS
ncbi:Phosphoadenosine phosphosulfate reductase [Roseimaritima multifibrata]|uniref:Adenosine 5'-phosphosulfate reductase n=1 Tax=Roseimaritima multifibrata TaxID=1930274 RepID=A0A517MH13_9BACT|nr:phosphoadenylyl-sulfate reductase [Roseimaritima multifibrata]QDS94172.1 Phosphoadenosine phosphosulfate reductase [Roseimaritima multifibrata]